MPKLVSFLLCYRHLKSIIHLCIIVSSFNFLFQEKREWKTSSCKRPELYKGLVHKTIQPLGIDSNSSFLGGQMASFCCLSSIYVDEEATGHTNVQETPRSLGLPLLLTNVCFLNFILFLSWQIRGTIFNYKSANSCLEC